MKNKTSGKKKSPTPKNAVNGGELYERFRRTSQKMKVIAYLFRPEGPRDFIEVDFALLDEGIGLILNDLSDEILEAAEAVYLLA